MTPKQIARKLERSIQNWDFQKAIDFSNNETKTRDYIIEPFFKILGFNEMDDYAHEFTIKFPDGNLKYLDMAITLSGRQPSILVECKKANTNLLSSHYKQLSSYYKYHKESKLGILTNGIQYKFYARSLKDKNILHENPFFEFDITDFTLSDLEELAAFYRPSIDLNSIIEDAEETYFLESFDEALFQTLYKPKKELIKLIYDNMGGKRLSDKISDSIFNLINSISYEQAIDKIKRAESKDSKSGIITTAKELKSLDIIKTIVAMTSKINNKEIDRIGYKDYKGQFKIIVDNMPSKEICHIVIKDSKKYISINDKEYHIESVSAKEITKHRRHLVDSAIKYLK
tara:strand:- start:821 stop:1849 length:1029 start_codon:yes stop_codon:yes gene_type:complete